MSVINVDNTAVNESIKIYMLLTCWILSECDPWNKNDYWNKIY